MKDMPTVDWNGKKFIENYDQEVPLRLLKKIQSNSIGKSDNLIIEGDNLDALKALKPFYENQIKCIYIDPPYNIGKKGWVYKDNIDAPMIRNWLGTLVDSEDLSRHDKWACMIYPRLKLLQDLLSDDGLIFVSIDDTEFHLLKMIMNEIFGPKNFVAQLIWNTEGSTDNQLEIKVVHEYILVYIKNIEKKEKAFGNVIAPDISDGKLFQSHVENTATKNGKYNPASEVLLPKGFPSEVEKLDFPKTKLPKEFFKKVEEKNHIPRELSQEYGIHYPIKNTPMIIRNQKLLKPCKVFSGWGNLNKLNKFIQNNLKPFQEDGRDISYYISEEGVVVYRKERKDPRNILSVIREVGTTTQATAHLEDMGIDFDYPKPVDLISYLLKIGSRKDSIILDSFAGSGTTGEAVLRLNKEDGGDRKFILIEIENKICKNKTSKRIKNIIKGYTEKKSKEKHAGLGGGFQYCTLGKPLFDEDRKIDRSCIFEDLSSYIYFTETNDVLDKKKIKNNFIGSKNNVEYYVLFRKNEKNTLDNTFLKKLNKQVEKIIYADKCTISEDVLDEHNTIFKQIPYEVEGFKTP